MAVSLLVLVGAGLAAGADDRRVFSMRAPRHPVQAYAIPGLDVIVLRGKEGRVSAQPPTKGDPAKADPAPLDRSEIDRRVARVMYDTASLGTDLFNRGNHDGCFRLYQGALMAVQPVLDHRPKLAALIKEGLDSVGKLRPAEGAFVLRQVIDAVQLETSIAMMPAPPAPAPKPAGSAKESGKGTAKGPVQKPLWERLGGEKAVRAVVKDFVAAAAADPKVNFTRDGKYQLDEKGVARLEQLLVELISETTGGPLQYTGRNMKEIHAGMKITNGEFDALAVQLVIVLNKYKVPDAEKKELLKIVESTRQHIVEVK
jgi:hemoglobin